MRFSAVSARSLALAAGLAVIGSCAAAGASITPAAAAVTCPTVDPSTGAVSPPPTVGGNWSGCDLAGANMAGWKTYALDLSGANLTNASMNFAQISGGDMTGANLTGASLISASVSANLTDANLSDANLTGTNLTSADISGAIMATATLTEVGTFNTTGVPASLPSGWEDIDSYILGPSAEPGEAMLSGADLAGLDLDEANLSGADLSGANLSDTDLSNATLSGVESGNISGTPSLPSGWLLYNGYLVGNGAILASAGLSGADLAGMDFSSTDLASANLDSANLSGTDLDSANLSEANLTSANLDSASATSSNLSSASFTGATVSGLNLTDATLQGASLAAIDLSQATLTGVQSGFLTGTPTLPANWTLDDGYLVGPSANLTGATMNGLTMPGADLDGADLAQAEIENTNLSDANLSDATLTSANLTSADLTSADLTSASLSGANLTDADLDDAITTGADFTGVTWSGTTCPDGSNSNAHDSGCFSALDTTPPAASPELMSGGTEVDGWFNAPVTVSWNWTDTGTLNASMCTQDSTTVTNGPVTLTASCTDMAGNVGTDSVSLKVDTTRPVVKVTGVVAGRHYIAGKVPAAGCTTIETISRVATQAALSITTSGSHGIGPFTATCAGAVSVAGLGQAAPVRASYTIGYGFGGFATPRPGAIAPSARKIAFTFRLETANGRAISAGTASSLARARDVRVLFEGPGIRPMTATCAWSSRARVFACSVKIPARVRTGRRNKYTITAEENVGTGFYLVPAVQRVPNPETVYFM